MPLHFKLSMSSHVIADSPFNEEDTVLKIFKKKYYIYLLNYPKMNKKKTITIQQSWTGIEGDRWCYITGVK